MARLKAAIIGAGGIANSHAQALLQSSEQIEIVAAVDIDANRLAAFCDKYAIAGRYVDAQEMLTNERPNLVHICTPPLSHCDLIVMVLEAGAWAVCEKPLCASLAELARIQDAEQRTGQFCAGVFQWRSSSSASHLKHLVEERALGRPLVHICQTTWYRDHDYYAVPWRGKWNTELGGPSMGHGIHAMDLLLHILGEWQEVSAMTGTLDRVIEVEDVSLATVRFEKSGMASIINSVLSPHEESYLRFDFQKASLELRHLYGYSNKNWTLTLPKGIADPELEASWQAIPDDRPANHKSLVENVLASYQRGEPPAIPSAEAGRVIELITCIYKSAQIGQTVQRGSITPDDPYYQHVGGPLALQARS